MADPEPGEAGGDQWLVDGPGVVVAETPVEDPDLQRAVLGDPGDASPRGEGRGAEGKAQADRVSGPSPARAAPRSSSRRDTPGLLENGKGEFTITLS
ncbi:hypothetical protein ACFY19_11625 [Streptosporangium saharense]|uniref:hypothetical protein n=1 Tax=Streptosporangium saharense TaxID=1706840 RepID=UPI00368E7984